VIFLSKKANRNWKRNGPCQLIFEYQSYTEKMLECHTPRAMPKLHEQNPESHTPRAMPKLHGENARMPHSSSNAKVTRKKCQKATLLEQCQSYTNKMLECHTPRAMPKLQGKNARMPHTLRAMPKNRDFAEAWQEATFHFDTKQNFFPLEGNSLQINLSLSTWKNIFSLCTKTV
jgi:hypothetical protein